MIYYNATFIKSAATLEQLPTDNGIEVAFVGRSNSGKSSAINTITRQRHLAKTSKTPGRTQLINLFLLDEERRMVDLPGYGFAKVSESIKLRWQKTLANYLEDRQCLKGLILLMDIRHPLNALDNNMIQWCLARRLPLHILLTKSDKVSRSQGHQVMHQVKRTLGMHEDLISLQLFSSLKKHGLDEVYEKLNQWYDLPSE